jgi:N-acetyl-1-D-myo-inositol-2-amino-2-deoxy-alpha-D-glucopyranoside deacetylase
MRAHETQVTVDGDYFALSNEIGQRITGTEYYTRLAGPAVPRDARYRYERDLFAR